MIRTSAASVSVGLALSLTEGLCGCDGTTVVGGDDGGGSTNGDGGGNGGGNSCGARSVTTLPPAGYVEFVTATDLTSDPADSAPAKVVFQAALCADQFQAQQPRLLYQIDAQGTILFMVQLVDSAYQKTFFRVPVSNQRLAVDSGCLRNVADSAGDDFDPLNPPSNPCGPMRFAISPSGMTSGTPEGDYICVEVHATPSCWDCWFENGVWYEEIVSTGYYVALGSIDGVSVFGWAAVCDPQNKNATVSINTGDRVDFTWRHRLEYRTSSDPESLGYQEIVYAP